MNQQLQPDRSVLVIQTIGALLLGIFLYRQRSVVSQLRSDWPRHRLAYLFIAPAILVTLLTIVYPFFYNVLLSFSNMSLRNFRDWQMVGLQNYVQVLYEPRFLWIFLKTIVWTLLNLLFHLSIGLLLAVALNGPVRGKAVYRVLLILPWAIPAYITALSWRGMFDAEYGAINAFLTQWFGLEPVNWLGEEVNAFFACLITNIWLGFPFIMVIALGGMQGIPVEMYEAARMEGISRWKQFWHITLPMLRPVLTPAVTLGAIWTFNNLNVVWLVSNGGEPADKTHILVSYVYKSVFNLYQYGSGAALSMIIFAMLLVFSLTFLRRTQATESVT
ncbi:MAG TPA: sugar ABC transporter permease [Planctomycetaceae bacterium]|nr:sugar ABC transporter permease [Planctomycetaceae bacterium]